MLLAQTRSVWRWRLLAAACLVLPLIWLVALRPTPSPICPANLDKIRPGMHRAEVEELLGGPPGDYRQSGTIYDATAVVVPKGQTADDDELSLAWDDQWHGEGMLIVVHFDGTDKVQSAFGVLPSPPLWYRTLQGWLP